MRSPYGSKGKVIHAPTASDAERPFAKKAFNRQLTAANKVRVDASLYQRERQPKTAEGPVVWSSWQLQGKSKKALPLRGPMQQPNVSLSGKRIRYLEAKAVTYSDGTQGAACTMNIHHKSGYMGLKVDGQRKRRMPTATKRYTVTE